MGTIPSASSVQAEDYWREGGLPGLGMYISVMYISVASSWLLVQAATERRALSSMQSGQKVTSLDELQDIDELCVVEVGPTCKAMQGHARSCKIMQEASMLTKAHVFHVCLAGAGASGWERESAGVL